MNTADRCLPPTAWIRSLLRRRSVSPADAASATAPSGALDAAHHQRLAVLGELTASVLHQINGPLTYVLLNLERLAHETTTEEARASVRAAREGAELVRALTKDVTVFARGGVRSAGPVDLVDVVRAATRIVGARVRAAAELVEEVGAAPPVRGDATKLLQVVVNVLLNAADACEACGRPGRVVRVALAVDDGGDAAISIIDNADGVGLEDAAHVFTPFFTTKAPGKGTGLGLSLAKEIVEAVGGSITFRSVRGVGTSVRVVLPALRQTAVADARR
jgi:two-component system, NtrC family, sensor kinase